MSERASLIRWDIAEEHLDYLSDGRATDRADPYGFPEWLRYASPLAAMVMVAVTAVVWRAGVRHYESTGS